MDSICLLSCFQDVLLVLSHPLREQIVFEALAMHVDLWGGITIIGFYYL